MSEGNVDYVNNPNQRTPCVLVLDASLSMTNPVNGKLPIEELNSGLIEFEKSLKEDPSALTRVQLAVICVGGPRNEASLLLDWTDSVNFEAFPITAGGATPLAEGVLLALNLIDNCKHELRQAGISYTRPWMFVISDGEPTSDGELWNRSVQEALEAQSQKKVEIFSIAVEGANKDRLGELSTRPVIALDGLKFRELFVWVTGSLSAASRSRPGDRVDLPSTDPWRNVGV
jgi:uncharacterized protein YegL